MVTGSGRFLPLLSLMLAGCGARTVLALDPDPVAPVGGGGAAGAVAAGGGGASGQGGAPGGAGGAQAGQGGGAGKGGGGTGGAPPVTACAALSLGGPVVAVSTPDSTAPVWLGDAVALDDRALVTWRYPDVYTSILRPVGASGEPLGPGQYLQSLDGYPFSSAPVSLAAGHGRIGALVPGGAGTQSLVRLDPSGAPVAVTKVETGAPEVAALRALPGGFDFLAMVPDKEGHGGQIPGRLIAVDDGGQVTSTALPTERKLVARVSLPDGSFVLLTSEYPFFLSAPENPNQLWLRRFSGAGSPLGPDVIVAESTAFAGFGSDKGDTYAAAALAGDGLVVAWTASMEAGSALDLVSTRAFSLDGEPRGPVRNLGLPFPEPLQGLGVVSVGDSAIVAWVGPRNSNEAHDTLTQQVFAQVVAATGEPVAEPLLLGTWWTAQRPRLVATKAGALVMLEGTHGVFQDAWVEAIPLRCSP